MEDRKLLKVKDVPFIYLDMDMFNGNIEEVASKILGIKSELKIIYKRRQDSFEDNFLATGRIIPKFTLFEDYKLIELRIESDGYGGYEVLIDVFREETIAEYNDRIETNKKKSLAAKKVAKEKLRKKEEEEKLLLAKLLKKYNS